MSKKKNKSPKNSLLLTTLIAIGALVYFSFQSTTISSRSPVSGQTVKQSNSAKNIQQALPSNTNPRLENEGLAINPAAGMIPEDLPRMPEPPPEPLTDVAIQRAPFDPSEIPPELPDDLREQLLNPDTDIPEELRAQLLAPKGEIPEDIQKALNTPPKEVSIDEVNNPDFNPDF